MFGRLGVCMVTGQSFGLSSDTLVGMLLLQELWGRRWQECHIVHGAHRLHLRGGNEVGRGERAMARN